MRRGSSFFSPLGGLSLELVKPTDAAAVGRLGLRRLLPAQPRNLLHQRHVHQHSSPSHVPACGDEADEAIYPPLAKQSTERGAGQEGGVLRRMMVRTKETARRGRKRKTTVSSHAAAIPPPAMAPAAA